MPRPTFGRRKESPAAAPAGKKKSSGDIHVAGQMRQTQFITTYGIGSIVDYVNDTVVIAGTDDWDEESGIESRRIYNENLSALTQKEYFLKPKCGKKPTVFSHTKDIPSYIFPEQLYCPLCGNLYHYKEFASQERQRICPKCRKPLSPSRFILICENGHMEDFPYDWWIHRGKPCSSGVQFPRMKMQSIDGRSDMESLVIRCDSCGESRRIFGAFGENAFAEYHCRSHFPHLPDPDYFRDKFDCRKVMKAKLRTSTGVFFPVIQSALSIPPWSRDLMQILAAKYDLLRYVPEERIPDAVNDGRPAHQHYQPHEILRAWMQLKNQKENRQQRAEWDILYDEYLTLSGAVSAGTDDRQFSAYPADVPEKYADLIESVSVIERLTEVQAFCGFSRLYRSAPTVRISIQKKEWLPAAELRGEGFFLRFRESAVQAWAAAHEARYTSLQNSLQNAHIRMEKYSPAFVLLHSAAHLLIRQISASCGYSQASIREKIYSTFEKAPDKKMYGILIYVSSSDSDSSLGGLIQIADDAERLEAILDEMLRNALWCSGDPLCIHATDQGFQSLNHAACHDCMLLPETSCECFNILLDRVSVIGEPDTGTRGFFHT